MYLYWATTHENISIYNGACYLMPSKYKYDFKLGDKFYLKNGYLVKKAKNCPDFFYPLFSGENITMFKLTELFKKLQRNILCPAQNAKQ